MKTSLEVRRTPSVSCPNSDAHGSAEFPQRPSKETFDEIAHVTKMQLEPPPPVPVPVEVEAQPQPPPAVEPAPYGNSPATMGATPRTGTTPRPGSTPRAGSTPRPGGLTPRPGTPRLAEVEAVEPETETVIDAPLVRAYNLLRAFPF